MTLATLLVFSLVALIAIITPGPTVLLALANGSRHGVRRALPGMLGAVLSDFVLVGAVALGLGALLAASEFWFSVVKWAGAAYLAWLGLRMLRSRGGSLSAPQGESGTGGYSARSVLLKSFLVAVTNPKGYLFCSALLPQFIDPAAAQAPQYIAIALVFALIDFLVMLAYAFAGSRAARLLRGQAALWLDRLCGGMLLALAGSLAFYRRATN
ncbi:LysE family translocator [Comamonas testosteroni]|uniref:LysE family translocator n=1 Tax=Comamonas testosteroni TaxID=285 RepID=UPI0026EDC321|nr:LysE family translocator [Comamonas testosteroni]WQD45308.1 LysE family translocator [Comamonas testosteroni]